MFPNSQYSRVRSSRLLSRGALALALALALGTAGGGSMLSAPAMAKDAAPELSAGFRAIAAPLQKELEEAKKKQGDAATVAAVKAKVEAGLAAAQTPDDKFFAGNFAIQGSMLDNDTALQRRGLESVIGSGKLPAADVGKYNYYLGANAYSAKDFATARKAFGAAVAAGFRENDVEALLAESYFTENQAAQGLDVLMKSIEARTAAGTAAPEAWYRRGLGVAYNAKLLDQAGRYSNALVAAYPSTQNWSGAISVVRTVGNFQPQEMLDLLRLMARTKSFSEGSEYLDYAQVADARRLPGEVVKILDQGIAAGKIKAADNFVSESKGIANSRIASDKASLPGLERDARGASANATLAMAAGDAFLSYENPVTAEAMYQIAASKPGVDMGRALTRLGIAQADQGKYAEAQATFAKVTGVRKPIAALWTIYAAQRAKAPAPASTAG